MTANILERHHRSGLPPTVLYKSSYLHVLTHLLTQTRGTTDISNIRCIGLGRATCKLKAVYMREKVYSNLIPEQSNRIPWNSIGPLVVQLKVTKIILCTQFIKSVSTGIGLQSLPEWVFSARPGLRQICL